MTDTSKYLPVANILREKIKSGELAPGDPIPSRNELAMEYKINPATAARVIDALRAEGLVKSSQGARTIVRARPRMKLTADGETFRDRQSTGTTNEIAEARAQGHEDARNDIQRFDRDLPAPTEIAAIMHVDAGTPLVAKTLLFLVEGEPMRVMTTFYRRDLAAGTALAEPSLIKGGAARLFEAPDGPFRRTITRKVENVVIRMPSPEESDLLIIPAGVPVARVLSSLVDSEGEVLEVLDSLFPGDRYEFEYVIPIPPPT